MAEDPDVSFLYDEDKSDEAFKRQLRKEIRENNQDLLSKWTRPLTPCSPPPLSSLSSSPENREDITIPEKLTEKLDNMNTLFSDVVAPKEAALDAEGFLLLSSIGREQVCTCSHSFPLFYDSMKCVLWFMSIIESVQECNGELISCTDTQVESIQGKQLEFDYVQFAEKLVTLMSGRRGDDTLDWTVLGGNILSAGVFKKPPAVSFLWGVVSIIMSTVCVLVRV